MTTRYAVNCSILLTELPLLERPAAARAAGFDAVEFNEPGTGKIPFDQHLEALARVGYTGWVGLEYVPSSKRAFDWLSR
jgi:hydroxypyruvate isomerase